MIITNNNQNHILRGIRNNSSTGTPLSSSQSWPLATDIHKLHGSVHFSQICTSTRRRIAAHWETWWKFAAITRPQIQQSHRTIHSVPASDHIYCTMRLDRGKFDGNKQTKPIALDLHYRFQIIRLLQSQFYHHSISTFLAPNDTRHDLASNTKTPNINSTTNHQNCYKQYEILVPRLSNIIPNQKRTT